MPPAYGSAVDDPDDDDYVAQVLAREARDSSLKYSTEGLGAYVPRRPTGAAPKPNTRFLRHIIKDVDSHNTALKRKEEREARTKERLRQLREQGAASSSRDGRRDVDDRESKRKEREHRSDRRRQRSRSASQERDRRHRRRHDDDRDDRRSRRDRRRDDERSERSHQRRRRSYSRSRSPRNDSRRRRRSRSRSAERSRRHKDSREHRSERSRHTHKEPSPSTNLQSDSDPLEDIVGPLPFKEGQDIAAITRGRGAYKPNLSNIDAHFAPDYDPTLDVHPEEPTETKSTRRPVAGLTEDDDWELALEALRDRARWRQKGEERLREAGFNEDVVDRWKNHSAFTAGDGEKGIEDVKWSKRGEGREWDRGKYVNDDGHVDVKALW